MSEWVLELARLAEAGTPAVLVTVLSTEGSSPREAGAKMVVTAAETVGSIGGGRLEQTATEEGRALLAGLAEGRRPEGVIVRSLTLGPALGQCCGGAVTLLLELVAPPEWTVAVFGAGHVGRALVKLLADLPCRVEWIDAREGEFPAEIPRNVLRIVSDAPDEVAPALPGGCDVLVMTHSHALDQEVVEAVLRHARPRFLGLIGSQTKRAKCLARLEHRGFDEAARARLTCPIGLPAVGGKRPAEIAISVAAQLLQLQTESLAPGASRTGPASPH
jgi:xanthine dehydrogenase accessory factor